MFYNMFLELCTYEYVCIFAFINIALFMYVFITPPIYWKLRVEEVKRMFVNPDHKTTYINNA